jgi:hypothetical protein
MLHSDIYESINTLDTQCGRAYLAAMADFFAQFSTFFGAVGSHLVTLFAGCVATVTLGIFQKYVFKRPLSVKEDVAVFLLFLFFACFQAWRDEHRNTQSVIDEKSTLASEVNSCSANLRVDRAYSKGLEVQNGVARSTIDKQNTSLVQQQGTINSCVVSLGKMNPILREKIDVIMIPIGTIESKGHFVGPNALVKSYISELLIITNEPERKFHGDLKCDKNFFITQPPQIKATALMIMVGSEPPRVIANNEYEIAVNATGTEWNPTHPAYMQVDSYDQNVGQCTFTPED